MTHKLKSAWNRLALDQRGVTTSEFWLTGITVVSTVSGVITGSKATVIGVVVAAYAVSRGLKKINSNQH